MTDSPPPTWWSTVWAHLPGIFGALAAIAAAAVTIVRSVASITRRWSARRKRVANAAVQDALREVMATPEISAAFTSLVVADSERQRARVQKLEDRLEVLRAQHEECRAAQRRCLEENESLRRHAEEQATRIGELATRVQQLIDRCPRGECVRGGPL